MSEMPESWVTTTLGQVVNYADNETVDPADMPPEAWILELEDIERDTGKVLERKTVGERTPKSAKNRFHAGDVLYGKLRPYLNKVVRADQDGLCSSEIIAISPGLLDKNYLFYSMRSPGFIEYVSSVSHGMRMPRLGTQQAKSAPFALPPLAEQARIAAKLDELLAQVDTLKARIDGIPALLKRFRQSVLAAAVSGRLTEEWRMRREGKREGEGGAGSSPESWLVTKLDQCVQAQNGKAFPSADYREAGVRLIRPGNLHVSGHIVWTESNTVCLDEAYLEGNDRYVVRAGDIVMNLTAQSLKDDFLGRVCAYAGDAPALLNQRQCGRPQKLSATPDRFGKVLPCLITNSAL